MTNETELREPWEVLEELIESDEAESIRDYLERLSPTDTAFALSRLDRADQIALLHLLTPEQAAQLMVLLPDEQEADLIEELDPEQAAAIVGELESDQQADLLGDLDDRDAQAILDQMPADEAQSARHLLTFDPNTAGGIMITEYLAYPATMRIGEVLRDLEEHGEEYSDYDIQYAYITGDRGELKGVLRQRDILFARKNETVQSVMIPAPLSVTVDRTIDELHRFFDDNKFIGAPVTDPEGRLVGVVRRRAVEAALEKTASRNFLKFSGIIGGEELRSMGLFPRSGRRLSWLSINIVLNIIAASVIAMYENTLAQVIALAVFLPIISDMSGCSGNQAVAVSMRELTLGLIRPKDLLRVLAKEFPIGVMNGIVLGILIGTVAWVWKGNGWIGLVVGVAMAGNTLVSVCIGGIVPVILKGLNLDPALVSAPMLTTVTDMCGFFLVLGLATMMLPLLVA